MVRGLELGVKAADPDPEATGDRVLPTPRL